MKQKYLPGTNHMHNIMMEMEEEEEEEEEKRERR
jgi:hypothetical protein